MRRSDWSKGESSMLEEEANRKPLPSATQNLFLQKRHEIIFGGSSDCLFFIVWSSLRFFFFGTIEEKEPMVTFTNTAVAAWLLSLAVANASPNGGSSIPLFGRRPSSNEDKTSNTEDRALSPVSWPWVSSGGATEPLVLSKDEELGTVEVTIPLSQATFVQKQGRDSPLFRDINMLTDILLEVVKDEDEKIYDLYFEFLKYGQER